MAAETRPTMQMKNFIGQIILLAGLILFISGVATAPGSNSKGEQYTTTAEVGEQEIALNNSQPYGINWKKFLGGIVMVAGTIVWAVRPNRDYSL